MSAQAINAEGLPGANLDPDAVEAAAADLLTQATSIRDQGADVKSTWQGLGAYYKAPESETLVAVMDPVATTTDTFASDLERVSAALSTYADDIRTIKTSLDTLRSDIATFRGDISGDDEWQFEQDNIDKNDALRTRAGDLQVQLWEAERTCANAIRAIDCIAPWTASTGDDDPNGYGYSEIPEDAEMPWGSQVEREDHCPKSAAVGVKRFVWDGIVMDIGWEGLKGLGGMIGLGEDGFSWETFDATWSGMGALIGRDPETGEWGWGTAGNAWTETGKSLIAWDMWAEDPARAAGTAIGNIALTVFTFGAGGVVKGTATAGRTGQVLNGIGKGASVVNRVLDPTDLIIGGAKALKGFKLDDVLAGLKTNLGDLSSNLSTSLRGIDIDVDIELPDNRRSDGSGAGTAEPGSGGVRNDDPAVNRGGDDTGATNNVNRDVDVSNEHPRSEQPTNTNQAETPAQQPVDLVREHELVGAGAPGSPSTHHGAGSHVVDGGGSSHGGSGGGHGSGGSGSGGHGSGGDGSGGHGTGGHGGSGDGTPGGPGDGTPGGSGNGSGGGDNGGGNPGQGAPGGPHSNNTPNTPLGQTVSGQQHYAEVLDAKLDELNVSPSKFETLVNTPFEQLSKADLDTLIEIRRDLPEVTPDTVLQKVIPPSDVHKLFVDMLDQVAEADISTPEGAALVSKFDDFVNANSDIFSGDLGKYPVNSVAGFVSRSADVSDLTTSQLFDSLGLAYDGTPFKPNGQDFFAVQFEAGPVTPSRADYTLQAARTHFDDLSGLSGYDYQIRLAEFVEQDFLSTQPPGKLSDLAADELKGRVDYALNAVDLENVHRGNGFGGEGSAAVPELQIFSRSSIPNGAELWKITPSGDRVTVATFINKRWELNL
jgi:hypothetical protein